jgi:hypothetical protein
MTTTTHTSNSVAARQRLLNTFDVDFTSTIDDCRYQGTFTVKKLSIRDLAALGVRKSQLSGGLHYDSTNPGHGVDQQTDEFNNMIAHLELAITQHPVWWNLDNITDLELLATVYGRVVEFENSFFLRSTGADTTALVGGIPGGGEADTPTADAGGNVTKVVGTEVQSSLEP